jgi:hypothetical protein
LIADPAQPLRVNAGLNGSSPLGLGGAQFEQFEKARTLSRSVWTAPL